MQTFDSLYFRGKNHYEKDGTQNCLAFQSIKRVVNSDYILDWKSKGLSVESIKSPSAPHNFLNPSLNYLGTKTRVRFGINCLNQDRITYIVYEINKNDNTSSDPTLTVCSVQLV